MRDEVRREREQAIRLLERRRCIRWLHELAASMNDPKAQQVLNSAAFGLGSEKGKPLPEPAANDCEVAAIIMRGRACAAVTKFRDSPEIVRRLAPDASDAAVRVARSIAWAIQLEIGGLSLSTTEDSDGAGPPDVF